MFFSHFMLFPTFLEKNLGKQNNYFSFNVLYAGNIVKCPFTYSYWLNGRWFLQIVDIGNFIMRLKILKSSPSLTGTLNGRWFLQIVDVHVDNFYMKLTGRWFPQIVQWESISNIYITKIVVLVSEPVRGRSRATELPCFLRKTILSDFTIYAI